MNGKDAIAQDHAIMSWCLSVALASVIALPCRTVITLLTTNVWSEEKERTSIIAFRDLQVIDGEGFEQCQGDAKLLGRLQKQDTTQNMKIRIDHTENKYGTLRAICALCFSSRSAAETLGSRGRLSIGCEIKGGLMLRILL